MARSLRNLPIEHPAHVVNRGNDRRTIFTSREMYADFLRLLALGKERYAVGVQAYCLMPNHFHTVLIPKEEGSVSAYLHWVSTCFACHVRSATQTQGTGHVFQHRFWSRVLTDVPYYLGVVRYVESNPLRAALVTRAEDWEWSSLHERLYASGRRILDASTVNLGEDWVDYVNWLQSPAELEQLRDTRRRGRPRKNA